MGMSETMKTCPFCGGVAKLKVPGYEHYSPCWVKCTQCGAEGPTKSSEEEAEKGWNKRVQDDKWISVKERMPVELHSIFWPWYGKKQWSNAMWREQSDKVLITVEFKDGTRLVSTGETHDGVWHTAISRTLDPIVTHWMQFPELPMEENK